jgi:hypothetical protein
VVKKAELARAFRGTKPPFGDIDLDPDDGGVGTKSDDAESFDFRYGRFGREDVIDCTSARGLLGDNIEEASKGAAVGEGSEVVALVKDVMKA